MKAIQEQPMTTIDLMLQAPSAFAEEPASGLSQKYGFVSTDKSVQVLRRHGWVPVAAFQQRPHAARRIGFQKHMIRFRKPQGSKPILGDTWPEIVLVNSHDASSSFMLHAGLFRLVCGNGLIVADKSLQQVRIRHTRCEEDEVVAATEMISERLPLIAQYVERMESRILADAERNAFAREAIALRWPEKPPVETEAVLEVRRFADKGKSLWTTYNVIQENLVRGCNGARRGVRSIDGTMQLNQKLWKLAASFVGE